MPVLPALPSQVEAVSTLVKGVAESVIVDAFKAARKRLAHTNPTEEQILQHVASRVVPPAVPGSPRYHREALEDLLALVHAHGMPDFFLTLTSDEVSELRWPDIDQLEKLAQSITSIDDLTFKDLSAAMAVHFHDRVQNFFKEHLLCAEDPLLGRITHWTLRYESQVRPEALPCFASLVVCRLHLAVLLHGCAASCNMSAMGQMTRTKRLSGCHVHPCTLCTSLIPLAPLLQHRGSLHVHALLWVDPEDRDLVASEITATRGRYKKVGDTWEDDVPGSASQPWEEMCTARRLFEIVNRKQVHRCKAGGHGCQERPGAPCRYGFPFAANLDGLQLDPVTNRRVVLCLLASQLDDAVALHAGHYCNQIMWVPHLCCLSCSCSPFFPLSSPDLGASCPATTGTSILATTRTTATSCPIIPPPC
jgi:hypothetical protein